MNEEIKLNNLLDNLSTAILLLDKNMQIQFANVSSESLFEHSRNQLFRHRLTEFLIGDCIKIERFYNALHNRDSFSENEVQLIFKDGRHCLASMIVTYYESESDNMLALEINPIDQIKKLNQENHQWVVQQASRDLIRGLAHEIKNPLGGIRGAAQLLERELQDSNLREFTQLIIEQSDRLRNLVDRLLGPNKPPDFQWINLHRVIEKIRTLLTLEHDSIIIERDYDPSIPDMYIDPDMLQQAILNIARNSVQALDGDGTLKFSTRIQRQSTIHGNRYPLCAQIKIIDNGPGIPDSIKDTLFYPMVSSKLEGTGLGLSISQSLINHHKGKIEVDSWPGHTEFTILIPIEKKEDIR